MNCLLGIVVAIQFMEHKREIMAKPNHDALASTHLNTKKDAKTKRPFIFKNMLDKSVRIC